MADLTEDSKLRLPLRTAGALYISVLLVGSMGGVALYKLDGLATWKQEHLLEAKAIQAELRAKDEALALQQQNQALAQEQMRGDVKLILRGMDDLKDAMRDLKQAAQVSGVGPR